MSEAGSHRETQRDDRLSGQAGGQGGQHPYSRGYQESRRQLHQFVSIGKHIIAQTE
jgi:hypothetical protein